MKDFLGNGNVLYLDHINVNFLIVRLYYSFTRYYQWYTEFLCIISYNFMWPYNYLYQKKKIALNDYVRLEYFWVIFYTWNSMIWGV